MTVTTIGYGDINPKKPFAMVAASTYGVVGLAAIGYILSKLSDKATAGVTNALNRLSVQVCVCVCVCVCVVVVGGGQKG